MSMKKKNTMPVLQLSFCHYCLCVSDFIHVKFVSFKFPTDDYRLCSSAEIYS